MVFGSRLICKSRRDPPDPFQPVLANACWECNSLRVACLRALSILRSSSTAAAAALFMHSGRAYAWGALTSSAA